nr:MAG TPA: DpnII restriction endonuclease [Caudoviricetes sp.]
MTFWRMLVKKVEKFSPKYFVDWRKVTNFALGK